MAEGQIAVELRGYYLDLWRYPTSELLNSQLDLISLLEPNFLLVDLLRNAQLAHPTVSPLVSTPRSWRKWQPLETIFRRATRDHLPTGALLDPLSLDRDAPEARRLPGRLHRLHQLNYKQKPIFADRQLLCYSDPQWRRSVAEACYPLLEAFNFNALVFDVSMLAFYEPLTLAQLCFCPYCRRYVQDQLKLQPRQLGERITYDELFEWQQWAETNFLNFFQYLRSRWQKANSSLRFFLLLHPSQLLCGEATPLSSLLKEVGFDALCIRSADQEVFEHQLPRLLDRLAPDLPVILWLSPKSGEQWSGRVAQARLLPCNGHVVEFGGGLSETVSSEIKQSLYETLALSLEFQTPQAILELLKRAGELSRTTLPEFHQHLPTTQKLLSEHSMLTSSQQKELRERISALLPQIDAPSLQHILQRLQRSLNLLATEPD